MEEKFNIGIDLGGTKIETIVRLDWHGAVCPRDAPQPEHDLHRREQRLLWADQGPGLGDDGYRFRQQKRRH